MRTETSTTAAAFATIAAAPLPRHPRGRPSRTMALAIACGVALSAGNGNGVAFAFSPPYRASPPMTRIHDARTRLGYKHTDSNDEHYDLHAKNETALDGGRNVKVDVDIQVEIKKDVIYYNDMDDEPPESISGSADDWNATSAGQLGSSAQSPSASGDSGVTEDDKDLIHELETAIQEKKIDLDASDVDASEDTAPPRIHAIEPSKNKPAKKFQSPIQLIKKVPKVDPIHMSTVFFLKLIGDPGWAKKSPDSQDSLSSKKSGESKKPAIENWKTQMEKRRKGSTAFMATSYLEALSPGGDTKDENHKREEDDMLKSLRDQQGQLRREQLQAQKNAMHEATRRTNPKEAIDKRIEEGEKLRKKKERDRLEMLYVERKERLDAKKRNEQRYLAERERQNEVLEAKARERGEAAAGEGGEVGEDSKSEAPLRFTSRNGKRGIPILDRPYVKAPPLLVGSTLTISYSELTPFQRRAIEVAQRYHQEHCEGMEDSDDSLCRVGEDAGIQAAPIIAVIDGYTAATTEALPSTTQGPKQRYATFASIEIVGNTVSGEPSAVNLMGVGRAFLHDYFSSNDAGLTQEEEELSKLLERIQQFDRQQFYEDDDEEGHMPEVDDDGEDDEDLPTVMAEFDLVLDDSSVIPTDDPTSAEVTERRASSMHAITELYRCANQVYRLHEERKKLVAGLRAGVARLQLGKEGWKGGAEDCSVEFEDCDGLGDLFAGVIDNKAADEVLQREITTPPTEDAPRSRLETLENYGLGSYGVLSTLPDLTRELLGRLEPYYSPAHREREEHEAEVASFVALRALEAYASPEEVAEALAVPRSATQRLERARAIMTQHREELVELAERIGRELMECGEECTDLW